VIHFLPLFFSVQKAQVIGVMRMQALFPSQKGELVTALRKNRNAYFKEDALRFAASLSNALTAVISKINRNSGYLDELIKSMNHDQEIESVKIFSEDLKHMLQEQTPYLVESKDAAYLESIKTKKQIRRRLDDESLVEVISPLYLTKSSKRTIKGAVGIIISLDEVRALASTRRNTIILMSSIIIIAFILLIGVFFKRSVVNPLHELSDLARRVGRGDFSKKIEMNSSDEIGNLAVAFNQMSEDLKVSKGKIEGWNVELREKIELISNELREKQNQLIESEKMASLGILSSGIAHEINNPLGIILGNAQMLIKELNSNETLQNPQEALKLLQSVEDYTKRCSHIVNSLLQFARKKELQLIETNINAAVENAILFSEGRLQESNIEIVKYLMPESAPIMADSIQLEQVFINLLLNAESGMSEGGRVEVATAVNGENVLITFKILAHALFIINYQDSLFTHAMPFNGSFTKTVVPAPISLEISISPLCAFIIP